MRSKYFAASNRFESLEYKSHKDYIIWEEAIKKHKLIKIFKKHNVTNKFQLKRFVRQIQGTCNHLIHAYTGMRCSEVLSLKEDCLKATDSSSAKIIGITTKFQSKRKTAEWVTTFELIPIINILTKLSRVLASRIYFQDKKTYLFISTTNLSAKVNKTPKIISTSFKQNDCLPLKKELITITEESMKELEEIEYYRDWRSDKKYSIGSLWPFKTHQYRRSLAVYSIQSGLVSLGSLKSQFKHLHREMSYYYQVGSTNAKNILTIGNNHISKDIKKN